MSPGLTLALPRIIWTSCIKAPQIQVELKSHVSLKKTFVADCCIANEGVIHD